MFACVLPAATNYVDCSFTSYEGHDGSSWEKAFKTIQEGVAAASSGDVVLVAPGDYDDGGKADTISNGGLFNRVLIERKAIVLKSAAGAAKTRIIGRHDPATSDDPTYPGLGGNAIRCLCAIVNSASEKPVVEGFTFADGATDTTGNGGEYPKNCGGGILVWNTSSGAYSLNCDFVDCAITNCIALRAGGANAGTFVRCRIEDCDAFRTNSAACRYGSLYNCLIVRNGRRKPTAGAVEYIFSGVIVNCTFAGNAGQALKYYPGLVFNCLFSENGNTAQGKNDGTA